MDSLTGRIRSPDSDGGVEIHELIRANEIYAILRDDTKLIKVLSQFRRDRRINDAEDVRRRVVKSNQIAPMLDNAGR